MADRELLLTADGVDLTPYVRDWSSVQLTDAWDQHATLRADIRLDFTEAASISVAPYAIIVLRNLLTGDVLFEGVQGSDLERRTEDPHWIVVTVSAQGASSLLDLSPLQSDYTVPDTLAGAAADPEVRVITAGLLARSYDDARIPMPVSLWPLDGTYNLLQWAAPIGASAPTVYGAGTSPWQAIRSAAALGQPWDGNIGIGNGTGWTAKHVPGAGIMLARRSDAFLGAGPSFTGSGRPAEVVHTRYDDVVASGVVETWPSTAGYTGSRMVVDTTNGRTRTNGFLVTRGTLEMGALGSALDSLGPSVVDPIVSAVSFREGHPYALSDGYRIRTARTPLDVRVGQAVTFDHPFWGTVSGAVQSVQTRFLDGSYDASLSGQPYALDSGMTLSGAWTLDATAVSGTARRHRIHTISLSANPKSFTASARAAGLR